MLDVHVVLEEGGGLSVKDMKINFFAVELETGDGKKCQGRRGSEPKMSWTRKFD
jgi:hypothetical protein